MDLDRNLKVTGTQRSALSIQSAVNSAMPLIDANRRLLPWIAVSNLDQRSVANIRDQRGAEAGDASSSPVADAWEYDSRRTSIQESSSQLLRSIVAIGIERVGMPGIFAQIVKLSAEIGKVVTIAACFRFLPTRDFAQLSRKMKCYFPLRCFQRVSGIPRRTIGTVETSSTRSRVRKRRINNVVIGNSKNEFMHADPRQSICFAEQSVVRRALEFSKIIQVARSFRETGQDAGVLRKILRGYKPMRVVLVDLAGRRQHYSPPRRASSSCRTCIIAGTPPRST